MKNYLNTCKQIVPEFDEKEFPFSRELSDLYRNLSARPKEIKAFAAAIFENAWRKEGKDKPACGKQGQHKVKVTVQGLR